MIRMSSIGLGRWGKHIARELHELGALASYADTNAEHLKWGHTHLPGAHAHTVEEIAQDKRIDAVAIATPITTHHALVEYMVNAGKHVFIEKPFGTNVEGARRLTHVAEEQGLKLMVGYVYLYHPRYQEFKKHVAGKTLTEARAQWSKQGPFTVPLEINLLPHHIAFALDLFGTPEDVRIEHARGVETDLDELTTAFLYPERRFTSHISRLEEQKTHFLEANDTHHTVYRWDDVLVEEGPTPLRNELETFIHSISSGGPVTTDGAFAARVLTVYETVVKKLRQ